MKRENDPSAPNKALFNWYPGHMAKALREIKQKINLVDIILEIRDARVPVVSGNNFLNEELGEKRKLIILNKVNLADPKLIQEWTKWFDKQGEPYLFVNCFDKPTIKKMMVEAREIVVANRKKCNPDYVPTNSKFKMMIVGLPNTGKSTIINQITQKNIAKVADKPGQTKIQQWISLGKDIDLLDTPGIMPPQIDQEVHALWLSAIHAIPDDIADEEKTAIFVIKHLLKIKSKDFLERFKIESSEIELDDVLIKIAKLRGCLLPRNLPDLNRVYKIILAEFRRGELGKVCFQIQ